MQRINQKLLDLLHRVLRRFPRWKGIGFLGPGLDGKMIFLRRFSRHESAFLFSVNKGYMATFPTETILIYIMYSGDFVQLHFFESNCAKLGMTIRLSIQTAAICSCSKHGNNFDVPIKRPNKNCRIIKSNRKIVDIYI